MNDVSLKVGTCVGGKAVSYTVPAFDMGVIVPLNLISSKQAGFRKIWEDFIEQWIAEVMSTNLEKVKILLF